MDLPSLLKQRTDVLIDFLVQAADWAVEALVLFFKDVHGKALVFLQFILAH